MYKTASEIADRVLVKCAAVTREEIARGLSGVPGREGLTPEEVQQYAQEAYDRAYSDRKYSPLVAGGVGALAGGAIGSSMGLPGAATGAVAGGLAGAGVGQAARSGAARSAQRFNQGLGEVARTGRIPYDVSQEDLERYPEYAEGVQEDRVDQEALAQFRERAARQSRDRALRGALRGALVGNMVSDQGADASELRHTLAGGAVGGLEGYARGQQSNNRNTDLYERGYGPLAEALQRRYVD